MVAGCDSRGGPRARRCPGGERRTVVARVHAAPGADPDRDPRGEPHPPGPPADAPTALGGDGRRRARRRAAASALRRLRADPLPRALPPARCRWQLPHVDRRQADAADRRTPGHHRDAERQLTRPRRRLHRLDRDAGRRSGAGAGVGDLPRSRAGAVRRPAFPDDSRPGRRCGRRDLHGRRRRDQVRGRIPRAVRLRGDVLRRGASAAAPRAVGAEQDLSVG